MMAVNFLVEAGETRKRLLNRVGDYNLVERKKDGEKKKRPLLPLFDGICNLYVRYLLLVISSSPSEPQNLIT